MISAIKVFAKATPLHHHHSYSWLAHEFQPRWGFKENGKNFSSLRSLERNWRMSWNKVHLGKFSLAVEVFIRSDTPISRFQEKFLFSRALHLLELCGTGNWWPQHWRVASPWCAHWGLEIFGMIHRWNHVEDVLLLLLHRKIEVVGWLASSLWNSIQEQISL
jgi:hypothetical protein